MQHDVFICHASEDKDEVVRPLAEALRVEHVDVWYDEFSLQVGDSLRQAIDKGLAGSRYGLVVLSPAFFSKPWTQWELNALVSRMMQERRALILPVWHGVGPEEVGNYSPSLADIRALAAADGIASLCAGVLKVIRPSDGPLLVAKAELQRLGWNPPPLSDEWWLDIVEMRSVLSEEGTGSNPWLFPVSEDERSGPKSRGLAIAWTALQLDWQAEAEAMGIDQTTRPEQVHAFINGNAALKEACHAYPRVVADNVPQLLIREFSGPFADAFDELLATSEARWRAISNIYSPHTTCEKRYALRAPNFGGHTPEEVTHSWIQGGNLSAPQHPDTDYLIWLLSQDSAWMPQNVKAVLIEGILARGLWAAELAKGEIWNPMLAAAFGKDAEKPFSWTEAMRQALVTDVALSHGRLGIDEPVEPVVVALMRLDLKRSADAYELKRQRMRERRIQKAPKQ